MDEIVVSVRRVTAIIGDLTAADQEQNVGIGAINRAIQEMDEMTQQNAALVEQAAAAAMSLEEQARSLTHLVSTFKLDDVPGGVAQSDVGQSWHGTTHRPTAKLAFESAPGHSPEESDSDAVPRIGDTE